MTSAAVGTAVMFTMAMLLVVMAASYVGIEFQRTIEQILDGFIGTACNAAIEVNRSGRQGLLGSATDAAGNDGIDFLGLQETDQGTVALTIGVDDVSLDDMAIFDIIDLEFFRMAEMLEYIPIFIRNCYSYHNNFSSNLQ
jgi:hypothetical protein